MGEPAVVDDEHAVSEQRSLRTVPDFSGVDPQLLKIEKAITGRFSANVQAIMRQRRITQRQLGEVMGMTGGSVWDRLNGRHRWTAAEIIWLPGYLGVPLEELLR